MANSGVVKSWVVPDGYVTDQGTPYDGAHFSWEWSSSNKSSGVTTVTWKLYGKGRSSSPNNLKNSCKVEMVLGGKTTTLYNMSWTSESQDTNTGVNTCFNDSKDNSLRDSGSFDITHDTNGDASFTIKMTVAIWSSTTHINSNVVTLDSNPHSYIVTFDANSGSVSTASKTVTNGSTYGTLPTPTKTGNRFNGWYTNTTGGTKVTSSTNVSLNANQTLYARWTPYVLTLTYNANGGNYTKGEYADTSIFTYKANYGEGCSSNRTLYNVDTFGAIRNGHHINPGLEWNTEADGSGKSFNHSTNYGNAEDLAEELDLDLSDGDKSATIYVNWKPNTLTILYNANGSTFTLDPDTQEALSTDNYSSVGYYDSLYRDDGSLLNFNDLAVKPIVGKHLEQDLMWNTEPDGSGYNYSCLEGHQDVQSLAAYLRLNMSSGNVTINLYLNWVVNKYYVNIENAEVDQDTLIATHGVDTQLYETMNPRVGYTFTVFTTNKGTITDNMWLRVEEDLVDGDTITVTGNWRENFGMICFHQNGGNASETPAEISFSYTDSVVRVPQVSQLFKKSFSHIEYDATSWLIGEPTYNNDTIDSSQLISHIWQPNNDEVYPDPQESYKQFINPNLETDLQSYLEDGDFTINLYPNWTYNTLTLKYVLSSPNEVPDEEDSVCEMTYIYSDKLTFYYPNDDVFNWLPEGADKPVGYHINIDGWNAFYDRQTQENVRQLIDISSTNGTVAGSLILSELNMTYTPHITLRLCPFWERDSYLITYDSLGGTTVPATTVLYEQETQLSNIIPTLDGYSFVGWSTSQDATVEYYPGNNIIISGQTPSDIILYAVWGTGGSTVSNICYIKVNGVWKQGQVFSKSTTWKTSSPFTKSGGQYR